MAARISIPKTAKKGEVIEIKTLIGHPMESGFRRDALGNAIPRDILKEFKCIYDGETVFRAELFPAISANPFMTFHTVATVSGDLEFVWTDQDGVETRETVSIEVS